MNTITIHDIQTFGDQPTIHDLRLAEALGYDQPRDIRKLIKRNVDELGRYGEVCATVAQTSPSGGRPSEDFHLNEGQALLVSVKSATSTAADVREMIIKAFMEWRHGAPAGRELAEPLPDLCADAPLAARIDAVRLAHRLWGSERARSLWAKMGLPAVPPPLASEGGSDARACLRVLLEHDPAGDGRTVAMLIVEAIDDDAEADLLLRATGIRVAEDGEGFLIANISPALEAIYRGTEWQRRKWRLALRRLRGANPHGTTRFTAHGKQTRSTFLPLTLVDELM